MTGGCSPLNGLMTVCNAVIPSFRIGLAIARRLAEDGASVMISSRKAANVDKAVEEIKKTSIDAK